MEALIEAIASFVALILEVTRGIVSAIHHTILALLHKEKRENFKKEWKESNLFKVGVILCVTAVFLGTFLVYPFWKWAFNKHYMEEDEPIVKEVMEKPNQGITFEYKNKSGNSISVNISQDTAKNLWQKTKGVFKKKEQSDATEE